MVEHDARAQAVSDGPVERFHADPNRSEWDAGCLVTALIAPDFDAEGLNAALSRLRDECIAMTQPDARSLCRFLERRGFAGDDTTYESLDNSRLDRVLVKRRGIPITLAVLYVELGRALGLDIHGVGFPGHFLVRASDAVIDPFANRVVAAEDWRAWLREHDLLAHAGTTLNDATPDEIALRMLNNVKRVLFGHADGAAYATALDLIDAQLVLGAEPTTLHLERAEIWRRLGSVSSVRAALEDARETCNDERLCADIEGRLKAIANLPGSAKH